MAIEITPKREIKKFFWPIALLSFCIILLLAFGISYLYLDKSLKEFSQEIQNKEKDLVKSPSERLLEDELLLYESKINTFKELFSKHKKPLNVFDFLEQVCHPGVWFSDFDFSSSSEKITVSGEAENFITLGQQLLILKQAQGLKKVNLSEISMGEEGKVTFAFQLTLDSQIFK